MAGRRGRGGKKKREKNRRVGEGMGAQANSSCSLERGDRAFSSEPPGAWTDPEGHYLLKTHFIFLISKNKYCKEHILVTLYSPFQSLSCLRRSLNQQKKR